jgi:hypothetical protein
MQLLRLGTYIMFFKLAMSVRVQVRSCLTAVNFSYFIASNADLQYKTKHFICFVHRSVNMFLGSKAGRNQMSGVQ